MKGKAWRAIFKSGYLFLVLLLICRNSLYIVDIKLLSDNDSQMFSPICGLSVPSVD